MRNGGINLGLALATLALSGCTCATQAPSDVGLDASDGGTDAPIQDAPFIRPDVPVRAPLCGPINATSCPIQSASSVTACAFGEGAVFFDGAHCQETPSLACTAERGAFSSFEECAVVCAETYCDASKIYFSPSGDMSDCSTPGQPGPTCGGGRNAVTTLLGWTECEVFRTLDECLPEYDHYRCLQTDDGLVGPEIAWTQLRRASLLPFVTELVCGTPGL